MRHSMARTRSTSSSGRANAVASRYPKASATSRAACTSSAPTWGAEPAAGGDPPQVGAILADPPPTLTQVERDARGSLLHLDSERWIPSLQVRKHVSQRADELQGDLEGVESHGSGSFHVGGHARFRRKGRDDAVVRPVRRVHGNHGVGATVAPSREGPPT